MKMCDEHFVRIYPSHAIGFEFVVCNAPHECVIPKKRELVKMTGKLISFSRYETKCKSVYVRKTIEDMTFKTKFGADVNRENYANANNE